MDENLDSKKKEEDGKYPLENLDKMQVLQESRLFSETKPKPKNCILLITKVLYVLGQGVKLSKDESTKLFLQCTKLFGIKNKKLRRMLYLILKELSYSAEKTFIACNILTNDMNRSDKKDLPFKANVIRTLRTISDLQTFISMERHFVEALVDQDPSVCSSALISGLKVSLKSIEIVKRWTKQIVSSMKSRFHMPQYHSLALMYKLQVHDRLSVTKLISSSSQTFRSPLAHCLLIKYSMKVLRKSKNLNSDSSQNLLKFVNSCLSYKNEMIILEAAKGLTSLDNVDLKYIENSISEIRSNLLISTFEKAKSVSKFSGLKILYTLAGKHPDLVYSYCSSELEDLIQDSNKNISTLAITTLLKCSSADVDITKLTKQISSFMGDISDDFKITVINSIKVLIPRCPKHHIPILKFLNTIFSKFEGGFNVKNAVVKTVVALIKSNEKVLDYGISILCEFIEDCEFNILLQEIIFHLGEYGPKIEKPSMCIRYIYNRVFLESSSVRAAAVEALCKFGQQVPKLKDSIVVILKRILNDVNDDVRDRVILSISVLEEKVKFPNELKAVDYKKLDYNLLEYLEDETLHVKPFDIHNLKEIEKQVNEEEEDGKPEEEDDVEIESVEVQKNNYFMLIEKVKELKKLGKPVKTCEELYLTEKEGDYVVNCIKHIYKSHIVLQFNCTNNVKNQKLANVSIEIDLDEVDGLTTSFGTQANSLKFKETQPIVVCMEIDNPELFPTGNIGSNLNFKYLEIDETEENDDDEEYEEEQYDLEDLKIDMGDYLVQTDDVKLTDVFKSTWGGLGVENETIKKVELPMKDSFVEVIERVIKVVGLEPINKVEYSDKKSSQSLYFVGEIFNTGDQVLMAAKIIKEKDNSKCRIVIYIRGKSKHIREMIINRFIF